MTPSPPPDASGTLRGLVNLVAQSFAGAKTFLAAIVASAGIQVASLWNTNGSGSTDRCVVIGTNVADGTVNASAKLLVVSTGIGGTPIDYLWLTKDGSLRSLTGIFRGASATNGSIKVDDVSGVVLAYGSYSLSLASGLFIFGGSNGNAAYMDSSSGLWSVRGTDSSGTPGAVTISKSIGKAAIAVGASSVVITNTLAAAGDWCVITPHARDATCKELIAVVTAGFITVSGTANATAALPFSFALKKII